MKTLRLLDDAEKLKLCSNRYAEVVAHCSERNTTEPVDRVSTEGGAVFAGKNTHRELAWGVGMIALGGLPFPLTHLLLSGGCCY